MRMDVLGTGESYAYGCTRNWRTVCGWTYREPENRMRMDVSGTEESCANRHTGNQRILYRRIDTCGTEIEEIP